MGDRNAACATDTWIAYWISLYLFRLSIVCANTGEPTNDGQFKMPKIGEVKLKVAPGIFFAVLGAAIIYFSTSHPIAIKNGQNGDIQFERR